MCSFCQDPELAGKEIFLNTGCQHGKILSILTIIPQDKQITGGMQTSIQKAVAPEVRPRYMLYAILEVGLISARIDRYKWMSWSQPDDEYSFPVSVIDFTLFVDKYALLVGLKPAAYVEHMKQSMR